MRNLFFLTLTAILLVSCKKEEATIDYEIYSNVKLTQLRIQYTSNEKKISENISPISNPYQGMSPYKFVYRGSLTAEKQRGVTIFFDNQPELNAIWMVYQDVSQHSRWDKGTSEKSVTISIK